MVQKVGVKNKLNFGGKMAKIIGYCRVSSKKQVDNYSLEQQEQEILNKYENAVIFKEQYTGAKMSRPVLDEVLSTLQENDKLIVTRLDRLARTTVEGITVIEGLFKRGISIHVLNVGLLEDTEMGRFFIKILLAVAEMERNAIIERTRNGKEIAKTKPGFKDGRPKKFTHEQLDLALSMLTVNGGDKSYKEVERLMKISKSTLINANNKRKIK